MMPKYGKFYTEPDWGLVDYFAQLFHQVQYAPRDGSAFQEAHEILEENAFLFIQNCFWIMAHETHQHILLKPNEPEVVLWDAIEEARKARHAILLVLLKHRRWGASTFVSSFFTARTLFNPNTVTLVLPKEKPAGRKVFRMYETALDHLFHGPYDPEKKARYAKYQPLQGAGGRTGERMVFRGINDPTLGLNSEIEMMVPKEASRDGVGSIARGVGAQNLHLTEFAHWVNLDATMGALMSVLPDNPDAACIIETTSSGAGTQFHSFWEDCQNGDLPFRPLFIGWTSEKRNQTPFDTPKDRERFVQSLGQSDDDSFGNEWELMEAYKVTPEQLQWRRRIMRIRCGGSVSVWNHEYPLTAEMAFAETGSNFLNSAKMYVFMQEAYPAKKSGRLESYGFTNARLDERAEHQLVRIWEEPEEYSEYLIPVDLAENELAGDHIAAVVLKRMAFSHVATFRGDDSYRPRLHEAAEQIVRLARLYNDAWILPERNGLGIAFIQYVLEELHYAKIVSESDYMPERYPNGPGEIVRYGVSTHRGNRQAMMEGLRYLFEVEGFEIYDELVLQECQALRPVRIGNQYTHVQAPKKGMERKGVGSERGYYDDLAMALAIGYWVHGKLPPAKSRDELRYLARQREQALRSYRADAAVGVI